MPSLFAVFVHPRILAMLFLGLSSGLPLALTAGTLQAWMKSEGIDLTVIGTFALVSLPYGLKFLWSPLLDRFSLPFLGRRRGWMFTSQLLLIGAIYLMSILNPQEHLRLLAVAALVVAFLSASQDIVIDAFRTDSLTTEERGAGVSVFVLGYRIAMIISSSLALILADHLPWAQVYQLVGSLLLIGVVTTFMVREPPCTNPPRTLHDAVFLPFIEFLSRRGACEVLLFILLFKLPDVLAAALSTPFLLELGFSKSAIGTVNKGVGLGASIVGSLIAGGLMSRLSIKEALLSFGLFQAVTVLGFAVLAMVGQQSPTFVFAIVLENLGSGVGNTAFIAFLMSLCNKRFTATQYALFTSFTALTRSLCGSPSGYLARLCGWTPYFLLAACSAIPALLLLRRFEHWYCEEEQP